MPEVLVLEPRVYGDSSSFFFESFNARTFEQLTGQRVTFVQHNHSRSARGVLRGLHYQIRQAQGKLVRVSSGAIHAVVVDMRRSSPFFGRWVGVPLSAENHLHLWIPPGFAHGFLVTSENAEVQFSTTDYWAPEHELSVLWSDPAMAIEWPLNGAPILSNKDSHASLLANAEVFA